MPQTMRFLSKVVMSAVAMSAVVSVGVSADRLPSRNSKAAPSLPTTVLAPGEYDDTAVQYDGSWTVGSNPNLYRRADHYTNTPGASAGFRFSGTGFRLY